MTDTAHTVIPLTEIPVSSREQAKADILESNLFSTLAHSHETLTATLTTTMKEGEEKLNALALLQILQRFHLETVKISALVIHGVLAEEPFDETVYVPWDDEGLGRTVRLISRDNDVALTVCGTLPENGANGEIIHTFFKKEADAGKILSDGRIDFHELLRYPSAKAGDPLLQISLPRVEKNGLSHEGTPIQARAAKEYPIQLGKNVEKVYITTEEGRPCYNIKALREGVVVTQVGAEGIASIDVTDRIVLGKIDFSVGNIGSDVICPVSMQAESVNAGFTVKVAGSVTIRTIAGGEVEAGKKATVDQMLPESLLTAGDDIACRSSSASTLTSIGGTLSIQREAIDCTLNANRVVMNTAASLLLNTRINACAMDLSNVRIVGKNHVILGADLFAKHKELLMEKKRSNIAHREAADNLIKTKASLVDELKSLSAEFGEDNSVRPVFKEIVESLKAYDFEKLPPLMTSLKRGHTCLAVSEALRTIEVIKQQLLHFEGLDAKAKTLDNDIHETEEGLHGISFSINARLRPSAVIEIQLGDHTTDPLILTPPPEKDQDHAIRIKGKFTLENGLIISERSG
ncbi:flagellar assembly protein A [Desulfoluna sp.]|uniref:flagellar assembly protein A n=1 Tax=Desulfoluna sp. TaxID=2045199 RepID=UPI002608E78D|nr:flagellar assembly protein A [Desulfoluna sp.]